MPSDTNFKTQAERLKTWCQTRALPFWGDHGLDPRGGFWEDLALDGTPNREKLRRVRVQARQCYVFAHAAHLGWYDNAEAVAQHGWGFLKTKGLAGGKQITEGFRGCAHLLKADGTIHDDMRDTYAQAFLILAGSWRYRALGDPAGLGMARATLDFLNEFVKADNGGWFEGIPASLPRRQNPHMHLFEAFLAAYEATKEQAWLSLADDVFALFEAHFFDKPTGTLLEFFHEDWSPDAKTGHLTEPGHMMEWCWLIYWYGRLSGKDVGAYAEILYENGVKLGMNPKTGLLINECEITGVITKGESRCWPQTEYIKANVARARAGVDGAADLAGEMIDKMFTYYLDVPVAGGWHDQRDANGRVTSQEMPSSTFYHIFCAAAEVDVLATKLQVLWVNSHDYV